MTDAAPRKVFRNYPTYWFLGLTIVLYTVIALIQNPAKNNLTGIEFKRNEASFMTQLKERQDSLIGNALKNPNQFLLVGLLFCLVVTTGIYLNIYNLISVLKGKSVIKAALVQENVSWGLAAVAQVFVFLYFIEVLLIFLELLVVWLFKIGPLHGDAFAMLNSMARNMATAAYALWLAKHIYREPLSKIGLTSQRLFYNIKTGLVMYLAFVPALILGLLGVALISKIFSYKPIPQPVVQMYLKTTTPGWLALLTIFVAIAGPLIEEIIFRGFFYKAFRARWGIIGATVSTACIFALLHMNLVAFFPILMLGFFLAYLYERTGSLVPCMTAHVIHNVIMVSLTLFFKVHSAG